MGRRKHGAVIWAAVGSRCHAVTGAYSSSQSLARQAQPRVRQKSPPMAQHICPPWVGYFLASPLRRLVHKPEQILAGLITPGMTVLDVGSGMGFFTLPMARMAGPNGKVVCVEVQEAMLRSLRKRAQAAGLADRIIPRVCPPTSLGLGEFAGRIDFALAFAVVHETPDVRNFFAEVVQVFKPGAQCLVAEPKKRVSAQGFEESLQAARQAGLIVAGRPEVRQCYAALLRKEH
jgi:ubiquinone/menaquinone biosynthesis C-methylase UbiE